ncbi:2OG-Fe dioxygenase family protein [Actinophytocola sp.]|uniref:2OG-Fe dioxygenase family protein n=1 Tax=Actinophytocola sp. TaxID=1872138 RepID=UPI002D7ED15B|nr:2OG-Fe dioxygenase family protein [Actinophytocola sp.]HET9138873.1 2OG-Fe dioxygenase family protein [Actinophytocola sp.]
MAFRIRGSRRDIAHRARTKLGRVGYATIRDEDLGLPVFHRKQIRDSFFTPQVLRSYPDDIPADRLRARDVVRYDWVGDEVKLAEHHTVAIEDRGDHPGRREFTRADVLFDPVLSHWIRRVLALVPESDRQLSGTFGLNFFRTFTNVVTKPHRDGEEFIIVYVVDKVGAGARSQLFVPHEPDPHFEVELSPGDLIIFRDDMFEHNVTPLLPTGGHPPRRDALVCTVNYPDTYDLG